MDYDANYNSMNIFDMAALLQRMIHDENMAFYVSVEGEDMKIVRQEVVGGLITLHVDT